jgi:hypothetical protein
MKFLSPALRLSMDWNPVQLHYEGKRSNGEF